MNTKNTLANIVVLFAVLTSTAMAEPKNGFGLNAGYANHSRDCGGCAGSNTSGLSIGLDYQFSLSDKFSINPFLMSSSETSSNVSNVSLGHGIVGAQLRYWNEDVFFGGHIANYSEVLNGGGFSLSGTGIGSGLVAGWEKPDSSFIPYGPV